MYGLLLENLAEYIKSAYGEEKWEEIRRQANVDQTSFSTHQVYPENLIPKLSMKAQQILGISECDLMNQMGVHFIQFVSQYGYDRVLSVLGRHMRDFLNGLDNLHEYLKFSYPRMRAPSFICENETRQGLTLHYRTKRRGFVYYTMGQIQEVARHFYHKEMRIELLREEMLFDTLHVTFQLTFDNRAFTLASLAMTREEKHLPISASVLFEIFPFCIVFGSDMVIRSVGNSLMVILPDLLGKKITNWFDLVRPLIAFRFESILNRTNNIFELVTVDTVLNDRIDDKDRCGKEIVPYNPPPVDESDLPSEKNLRLKGQMIYMDNWKMMMYLGTPVMPDLNALIASGLYINDLSMHDFSRDLMLAGTQQSVELKLALDQEQQKSKKLEESMRKLDEEMRRTDELLYQMIPKQVADRLRTGENPIDTCEMFDSVSILFSDVVSFTEICSRITPMEVVSMLNAMYSIFDTLTERNKVYKVETIGDAYMVVSGAPEKENNHAEKVCDMALDMVEAIKDLKDPYTGFHLEIRVGVHSGAVVAGIVGLKMPRYCLFGDSVNTASRMESTSETMKINVSQSTKDLLPSQYELTERGEVEVKGKGMMKTYWLEKCLSRTPLTRIMTGIKVQTPEPEWEKIVNLRDSLIGLQNLSFSQDESRRVYSPVTFQDIAIRRSIANTPVRVTETRGREARSNSMGAVHYGRLRSQNDLYSSSYDDATNFIFPPPNLNNPHVNTPKQITANIINSANLYKPNKFQNVNPQTSYSSTLYKPIQRQNPSTSSVQVQTAISQQVSFNHRKSFDDNTKLSRVSEEESSKSVQTNDLPNEIGNNGIQQRNNKQETNQNDLNGLNLQISNLKQLNIEQNKQNEEQPKQILQKMDKLPTSHSDSELIYTTSHQQAAGETGAKNDLTDSKNCQHLNSSHSQNFLYNKQLPIDNDAACCKMFTDNRQKQKLLKSNNCAIN